MKSLILGVKKGINVADKQALHDSRFDELFRAMRSIVSGNIKQTSLGTVTIMKMPDTDKNFISLRVSFKDMFPHIESGMVWKILKDVCNKELMGVDIVPGKSGVQRMTTEYGGTEYLIIFYSEDNIVLSFLDADFVKNSVLKILTLYECLEDYLSKSKVKIKPLKVVTL